MLKVEDFRHTLNLNMDNVGSVKGYNKHLFHYIQNEFHNSVSFWLKMSCRKTHNLIDLAYFAELQIINTNSVPGCSYGVTRYLLQGWPLSPSETPFKSKPLCGRSSNWLIFDVLKMKISWQEPGQLDTILRIFMKTYL